MINKGWFFCLDYLGQGTLYGGQPQNCIYGPVFYSMLYLIRGLFDNSFLSAVNMLVVIAHLAVLYFLYKIIKKETGKYFLILIAALYFFLIVIHIQFHLHLFIASVYFFIGFYFLFYSTLKYKEIIAGVFFALSIFSAMNSLLLLFIIIFFYIINILKFKRINKKICYTLKELYKTILIIFPIIILLGILILIFPNMLSYTLFVYLTPEQITPGEEILTRGALNPGMVFTNFKQFFFESPKYISMTLVQRNTQLIFLLSLIILSGYSWFSKRKNVASAISFFGSLLILYGMFVTNPNYTHRYLLIIMPFFILVIISL
jgi:hypothetical protein